MSRKDAANDSSGEHFALYGYDGFWPIFAVHKITRKVRFQSVAGSSGSDVRQAVRDKSKREVHAKAKAQVKEGGEVRKISQKSIQGGAAITWRFMRRANGIWQVSFSTDVAVPKQVSHRQLSAIGVDINAGFITVAEADRFGNILRANRITIPETGRSAGQRDAARGEAVKQVMARCTATRKPLVLEALDFTAKKRDLRVRYGEARRKLSALPRK